MSKEKVNKRQIHSAETKMKIYKAAKELFLVNNVDDVSVDSIVKKAGVAKGSFYVHYESKAALVSILFKDYVDEIDMDYKTFLESISQGKSALDVIILLTEKIADILNNKIGHDNMKRLYKSQLASSISLEPTMGYGRELYKMFDEILTDGVRKGEIRSDIPVTALANHLILAIRGIAYEWCIRYPEFNLKEECVNHMDILLRGIAIR
jgi:AcrR family transcriptional regulator